jgi:hypothetical protein
MVGKGGVEPPRPFGHTDLNRARLPFRHFPVADAAYDTAGGRLTVHITLSSSRRRAITTGGVWEE